MVTVLSIPNLSFRHDVRLDNCVNENALLHIRNLCDFCTSGRSNDIKPSDLFDDYAKDPKKYRVLRRLMRRVDKKYGKPVRKPSPPRAGQGSARWAFNKKLAHPTKTRGRKFDYTRYANRVLPALQDVIAEIERIRKRRLETLL
jgi:hypothetical protein